MKTFYIAARPSSRADEVKDLQRILISKGLESSFDWVNCGRVKRPYEDYPKDSATLADKMIAAAYSSDLFILLHDKDLEGALMEYGVARYVASKDNNRKLIVVETGGRDSIFLHRENIIILESIDELKKWITENL